MKSLAEQLVDKLKPRLESLNEKVAPILAEDIRLRMLDNTRQGKAFGNDTYDNSYSVQYAKRTQRSISPVTLRGTKNSIEKYEVMKSIGPKVQGASIELIGQSTGGKRNTDKAIIFGYHHKGTARGGKMRSIFPKTSDSVPLDIKGNAVENVRKVLQGEI